jgi:hypothetical protein
MILELKRKMFKFTVGGPFYSVPLFYDSLASEFERVEKLSTPRDAFLPAFML